MNSLQPPQSAARERWLVASALGVTQIFSFGTTYYLHGVLGGSIRAETHWDLSFLAASQSAGMLVAGIVASVAGRSIDRYGGRFPLAAGFAMFAVGLAVIGASASKMIFLAGWLMLGIGMGVSLYDGVFAALGKAYGRQARQPIGTVTLWGGFASTVCWPLSALLVDSIGWRGVCLVFAGIHLVLCMPLVLWSLSDRAKAGSVPMAADAAEVEPVNENGPIFYLFMAISVLAGMGMTVIYVHLIPLLEARGLTLAAAVSLGALLGPSQVAARAIDMLFGTRHHPVWTLMVSLGLMVAGVGLFAMHFPLIGLSIVLFAAGNGIYSIVRGALPLALFGPRRYASIMGRLAQPLFIAQAVAPTVGALTITSVGASGTLAILAVATVVNFLAGLALLRMVRR